MDAGNQFLGTEPIGKLMRQYAAPCIISLLVGALYNIVDQIFIMIATVAGAITNLILEPMHIGIVKSEVRILGTDSKQDVVLLCPMEPVENGDKVF